MMKLVRPSLWLPSTMVAWGLIATLMGVVTNFGGLLAARAALGLAEGGKHRRTIGIVRHQANSFARSLSWYQLLVSGAFSRNLG